MKKVLVIIFCFFMFQINVRAISASSYIVMDMDTNNVLKGNSYYDY